MSPAQFANCGFDADSTSLSVAIQPGDWRLG